MKCQENLPFTPVHTSCGLFGLERTKNELNHRGWSCDTGESKRISPLTNLPTVPRLPFSPDLSNSIPNSVLQSHTKFDFSTPSALLYVEPYLNFFLVYASSFLLSSSFQTIWTLFLRRSVFLY
jgi:hypothetical protein